jgi:hypothetical protein
MSLLLFVRRFNGTQFTVAYAQALQRGEAACHAAAYEGLKVHVRLDTTKSQLQPLTPFAVVRMYSGDLRCWCLSACPAVFQIAVCIVTLLVTRPVITLCVYVGACSCASGCLDRQLLH